MTNVKEQTQQELAFLIAQGTLDGFNRHYRLFRETSRYAKSLFEAGQWTEIQRISRERIQFYDRRITETVQYLQRRFNTDQLPDTIWQQVKLDYIGLLTNHKQPELAESFFNSVSCRILHRNYYHNDFLFVRPALSTEYIDSRSANVSKLLSVQGWSAHNHCARPARLRLAQPVPRLAPRYALVAARGADSPWSADRAGGQPPDPGTVVTVFPQQGRIRDRQDRQRQS